MNSFTYSTIEYMMNNREIEKDDGCKNHTKLDRTDPQITFVKEREHIVYLHQNFYTRHMYIN